MDNVGCHGTEDRLIDCAYHTDTSEDSHSGDVWIKCDTASSDPDGTNRANNITGLIVAVVALVGLILLAIAFVAYIIYTRQTGVQERMK